MCVDPPDDDPSEPKLGVEQARAAVALLHAADARRQQAGDGVQRLIGRHQVRLDRLRHASGLPEQRHYVDAVGRHPLGQRRLAQASGAYLQQRQVAAGHGPDRGVPQEALDAVSVQAGHLHPAVAQPAVRGRLRQLLVAADHVSGSDDQAVGADNDPGAEPRPRHLPVCGPALDLDADHGGAVALQHRSAVRWRLRRGRMGESHAEQ